ncbi:hypothetical protein FP2506_00460 [Fulvimarina pelagi HTCC2506]|uniref:Uncharacterized protein n=1 Tax=Fulvimarina pelagi HTCC2506 TaxID=314231 RepID=Q0FXP3_9HYPH|nr:toprim domain-containing protein [Fulvimarina pelagi]EAU39840.1 hypothetical protein FP2506_00460 [Fulvimarina pelagi HTCC2506]
MDTIADIATALAANAEGFCQTYLPNGRRSGGYWTVGDVTGAKGESLAVRLTGSADRPPGKWTDYATSEHGDLLDLMGHLTSATTVPEALDEARRFLGWPRYGKQPASLSAARRRSRPKPLERLSEKAHETRTSARKRARRLWSLGKPIAGTPAETYLTSRGIARLGDALRYHPAVRYRDAETSELKAAPALLAKITGQFGETTGVSRTWLDPERGTLADMTDPKRVMGDLRGSGVRLSDPASPILAVGEGIETVLSVGSVLPKLSVTACLSATHLSLFDVPETVQELWIVKDADDAGARAARTLRERLVGRTIVIREIEPVLGDFNDDLTAWGPDALRARLRHDFGDRIDQLAG